MIKEIGYYLKKRNMVKFVEDDVPTKLEIEVDDVFIKGDKVEVEYKDDKIVSIKKVKSEKKEEKNQETKSEEKADETEEPKEESKSEKKKEVSKETVFAVSGNKEVVKFSQDGAWVHVSDTVKNQDYDKIGLIAKNDVEVTLTDGIVTFVKNLGTKKPEDKTPTKSGWRDEKSTDVRTASMNANNIICAMIKAGREEVNSPESIKKIIDGLTKKCYKAIKEIEE